MRTKDEARGKKSGEIQVIQDGAGMFHHYRRESWLVHKGVQPTRKIKENRELSHLPLGDSFLAALGSHYMLCLSFSFCEMKITSFTFFRMWL